CRSLGRSAPWGTERGTTAPRQLRASKAKTVEHGTPRLLVKPLFADGPLLLRRRCYSTGFENRGAHVNLSFWFQELKKRRVFRALVAYAIAAFAILQVIEPVMHGLALPDWVLKVVVIGLGLGLPVTLLLAWAYDIGPRGIERTPSPAGVDVKPRARAYRALVLTAAGLLVASPAVVYSLVRNSPTPGATVVASDPAGTAGPSVAVLPFVNMSDDTANEYFSDGLSEEILNALAQIPNLRVPARTSSFAFKG